MWRPQYTVAIIGLIGAVISALISGYFNYHKGTAKWENIARENNWIPKKNVHALGKLIKSEGHDREGKRVKNKD